jgi:hypothetical protein
MPYCRQSHFAGNGETARLTSGEADGDDAKFRASHAYSSCIPTFSLFCCHEQSKGVNHRQLRQPRSLKAAGAQDGQVVGEKGYMRCFYPGVA